MSTTALETDLPQLSATQLIARPGTLPTLTFPMTEGSVPNVDGIWKYLCEPAEFFGVPMPTADELAAAISDGPVAAVGHPVFAVDVTIAELAGAPQILVSRSAMPPVRNDAVGVAGGASLAPLHRSTDPWWQRMAARTTSRGPVDQLERWLNGRGFADAVVGDVPIVGALVFLVGGDVVGVENPEPTSILEQLTQCGAISAINRVDARPIDAEQAWWISPRYQTHPVATIDGVPFPAAKTGRPPFARWP